MTAVGWLIEQLSNYDLKMIKLFEKEIQQAKEMEKQQHSVTYGNALKDMIHNKINFEQYYNEKYNKNEK